MPTGGQALVDVLAKAEVRHIFTVPGESFLDVLDALHDRTDIVPITTRNEAGAATMAEATGKLTGRPGAALVTRGPGAVNALPGVYVAARDASPMLLLVALAKRSVLPQFQAIDLASVYGGLAKSCAVVSEPEILVQTIEAALDEAISGRPGPAVVGIPEDILSREVAGASSSQTLRETARVHETDAKRLLTFLAHAERPLLIAGGGPWSPAAADALARFTGRHDLPVASAFRRQDRLDNRTSTYVGHLGLQIDAQLAKGVRAADLIIVLGDALGPVTTRNYTLIEAPRPAQQLVLVRPAFNHGEAAIRPTHTIEAAPGRFLETLAAAATGPSHGARWSVWRRDLRAAYLSTIRPRETSQRIDLDAIIAQLSGALPENAIVCSGAGDYAASVHRSFVYKFYPSQLAPTSGSMGYGLPAAIAAKLVYPERTVVAIAGDGCLQMTVQELATATQFSLPIIIIVANNARLGTIRSHQEARFPGRVVATSLLNPDFQELAAAYGVAAKRVIRTAEFLPALETALGANEPFLIELMLD